MNTTTIERELNTLSLEVYRLRLALQAGDYRRAIEQLQAAGASQEIVASELAKLAKAIGERDLSEELAESVRAVEGDDAA